MLHKFFAAALTLTVFCAPAYASAVYEFTFDNTANGGGTVHGKVTLPSSADGTYAASSVVVTSNTAGFGLGEYVGNPTDNSFVISGGKITDASVFLHFGFQNSSPAVVCCSLTLGDQFGTGSLWAGLADSPDQVSSAQVPVTFKREAAPLRAALPLLVSGLGVLGLMDWRRKRSWRLELSRDVDSIGRPLAGFTAFIVSGRTV